MNRGITKENLLLIAPPALRHDKSIMALMEADAGALAARLAEIDQARVISNIDGLDEQLLDILAYDFKVDWWDPEYSIDEKRRTLKGSWRVHKILGTKAAVETAIRAIYPLTTVEEWFEYGGEPYHFRLNIDITSDSGDRARQKRVLERVNFYKSLRSHSDGVRYFLTPEKSWVAAGGLFTGSRSVDRAFIAVPPLLRPGGSGAAAAGGRLTGARRKDRASISIPPLVRPGGRDSPVTGGAFTGYRGRMEAAVTVPPLARPQGAAARAASAGYIGSAERVTVKLDAGRVKAPTGRAATSGAAGVFHSYQRMGITVPVAVSAQ